MKVGDRVKVKTLPKGDQVAFYAHVATPDEVYEVEYITKTGDVYVKGRINYFKQSSLEVVE